MTDTAPTPAEVDEFILTELPATFQSLVRCSPNRDAWYRPIDRGLQRLRKAGRIDYHREGRFIYWEEVLHV